MIETSVRVVQGVVKGCREMLPNGKSYLRYSKIPFAKKPIGELKFRSPQKLLKFDTPEIDCTQEGDECFHKSTFTGEYVGSEDCLYLNVYVPEVASDKKLSVMVWIHGGGFSFGSGSQTWFSPEYLLIENVIVVTMNYRLHILGFLVLPSMGINGNAGLKDQQMALEWVYENISNFNGDPENICLFGESAGASSVHLQVLNRKSRKMIKSAICQSGCAINDWAIQRDGIGRTKKVAELLGCTSQDEREIYETLMKAPLKELFRKGFAANLKDERRRNLNFVFKPVIEIESSDAFMSKSPVELMKHEKIDIPIIFGANDKDGMIQATYAMRDFSSFENDPVRMVPISLNIDPDSAAALKIGKEVKKFYFGNEKIDKSQIDKFNDLMTDLHFLTAQTACNELHAKYQKNGQQFLYEFRFDGELNLYKKILQMDFCKGACHADELFYLFG